MNKYDKEMFAGLIIFLGLLTHHAVMGQEGNATKAATFSVKQADAVKNALKDGSLAIEKFAADGPMKDFFTAIGPAFGAVGSFVGLVAAFIPSGPSAELKAIQSGFADVNDRIDVIDQKIDQLGDKVAHIETVGKYKELVNLMAPLEQNYKVFGQAIASGDRKSIFDQLATMVKMCDPASVNSPSSIHSRMVQYVTDTSVSPTLIGSLVSGAQSDAGLYDNYTSYFQNAIISAMYKDSICQGFRQANAVQMQIAANTNAESLSKAMRAMRDGAIQVKTGAGDNIVADVKAVLDAKHDANSQETADALLAKLSPKYKWLNFYVAVYSDSARGNNNHHINCPQECPKGTSVADYDASKLVLTISPNYYTQFGSNGKNAVVFYGPNIQAWVPIYDQAFDDSMQGNDDKANAKDMSKVITQNVEARTEGTKVCLIHVVVPEAKVTHAADAGYHILDKWNWAKQCGPGSQPAPQLPPPHDIIGPLRRKRENGCFHKQNFYYVAVGTAMAKCSLAQSLDPLKAVPIPADAVQTRRRRKRDSDTAYLDQEFRHFFTNVLPPLIQHTINEVHGNGAVPEPEPEPANTPAPAYPVVTTAQPHPAPAYPVVTTAQPPPAPAYPVVTTAQPPPASAYPVVTTAQPPPAPAYPVVTTAQPAPAPAYPVQTTTQTAAYPAPQKSIPASST